MSKRKRTRSSIAGGGLLLAWVVMSVLPASAAAKAAPSGATSAQGAGDGERQTALVTAEDQRLAQLGSLATLAQSKLKVFDSPFRFKVSGGYSLVLTPRKTPYGVKDLLKLAPKTFTHQADGSYLLSENIFLLGGAGLSLTTPGLVLHLESDSQRFVSIVSEGGFLEVRGSEAAPIKISSWDSTSASPDTALGDGRAYLRSIGGQVSIQYLGLSHVGFWSGRTGGLALTGSDRPNTGALDLLRTKAASPAGRAQLQPVPPQGAPPDITNYANKALKAALSALVGTQSDATGYVGHLTSDSNAYGLFVSGASDVNIADSTLTRNTFGGAVLHRYVHSAVIQRTVSSYNEGDGFRVARASDGIRLLHNTSDHNGHNGFTLDGSPLSNGTSVSGLSPRSYGGDLMLGNIARDNFAYGIDVRGGINSVVRQNSTFGGSMGVVVRADAHGMSITDNRINAPRIHGIAVEDGPKSTTVKGNTISSAATGIYVRDAAAVLVDNGIRGGSRHGISLIGNVAGTQVTGNTITGHGDGAIDSRRASGREPHIGRNYAAGWTDVRSWSRHIRGFLSPVVIIWILVLGSAAAMAMASRRRGPRPRRPYESTMKQSPPAVADLVSR